MKKNYVFFVIMGLLFFLSACAVKEERSQDKESEGIIIDTPYLLEEGSIITSGENVTIGAINYSLSKVSTIAGVNNTKLAIIYFKVTNKTKQEIIPNEFWFRYVKVTQNNEDPLPIGALPYENKEDNNGQLIKQANQGLKKDTTVDVAVAYILDGTADLNVIFMNTEYKELAKNSYSVKE